MLRYCKKFVVSLLNNQIRVQTPLQKETFSSIRTDTGKRVALSTGEISPVLGPLLSSLPSAFVGALTYEQCVVLNGAAAKLQKVERLSSFDLLAQLQPGIVSDLISSLSPWLLVNAYELRHRTTMGLVLRILLAIDARGVANTEQIRTALSVHAVYITMCCMRKAGVIEQTKQVRSKDKAGFKLTMKGHKLLELALKAVERRESQLFQNLNAIPL